MCPPIAALPALMSSLATTAAGAASYIGGAAMTGLSAVGTGLSAAGTWASALEAAEIGNIITGAGLVDSHQKYKSGKHDQEVATAKVDKQNRQAREKAARDDAAERAKLKTNASIVQAPTKKKRGRHTLRVG